MEKKNEEDEDEMKKKNVSLCNELLSHLRVESWEENERMNKMR